MAELQKKVRQQLIVFTLSEVRFAVPIEQVWRVEPLAEQRLSRVPRSPAFLEGVVNVRGRVLPVLDLKKRFGLPASAPLPKARLLIVELEEQYVGLIVDTVEDILWFPTARIEEPPAMIAQISGEFVQGVGQGPEELLVILDLHRVLSLDERRQLRQAELGSE
ncbi:MAG: chemotaxis protein CheW [Chloroflexia bacterium]|nr:chemotaxis protein CheW [Chloroflexia bacterium]